MGYLARSRAVLEIDDEKTLYELLEQQQGELKKLNLCFGRKRGTPLAGKATNKDKKAIKNVRRNIARIKTRLSQLRIQKVRS